MKRRIFCDAWKWCEIQISMFINTVLLEHSHVSFSIAIKKLCNCDRDYMWPEKPKIYTLWPIRGKVCWSLFWSVYEPGVMDELGILCDPEIIYSTCVHLCGRLYFSVQCSRHFIQLLKRSIKLRTIVSGRSQNKQTFSEERVSQ